MNPKHTNAIEFDIAIGAGGNMVAQKALQGLAFASDYDGTLCETNWETGEEHFDPKDLAAVRRFQEQGGLFGLCTGRPLPAVTESLRGVLDVDFYILTTGAQVLDRNRKPLFEGKITRDVAEAFIERYGSGAGTPIVVTSECFASVGRPFGIGEGKLPELENLAAAPGDIFGLSLEYGTDAEAARMACEDINRHFAGRLAGFQNLGSVDVVAAGCSKGAGLRKAKQELGVRVMAGMGDSYNDLPMLEAADVSYTFPKAPAVVQNEATCVLDSIAAALEDFSLRA